MYDGESGTPPPSAPPSRSWRVVRFLCEGQSQSRIAQERRKLCGARLQPLQGGASLVPHRILLHRCATGAPQIGCPRTLLTSCCVRAWQDRSRDCLRASPRSWAVCSPTLRPARAGMRLVGGLGRSEERDRRDCAMHCARRLYIIRIRMLVPVLGCTVDPDSDLRLSG